MSTHSSMRRRLVVMVVAATGVTVGTGVSAFAIGSESPATATVCIKPNGQLRVATAANPVCVEPEAAAEWTVNGVKEVTAGAGLISRNNGGIVELQVDPGLVANANSGKIVAGFDDGPRGVPDGLSSIAELPLPAGNYAIFAKLSLRNPFDSEKAPVRCRLEAGADFDQTLTLVEGDNFDSVHDDEDSSALAQSLEVVHQFTEPGSAIVSCDDSLFYGVGPRDVLYEDLKIIAIRGSSLSNTFIGE
jgi:hypothetical protein